MALTVASLNSGSNGNCYYIGNERDAILVDAGISCRETEKRLKRLGLDIGLIKAVFITHEHGDHIFGLPALSRRHQLPVYITPRTLEQSALEVESHLVRDFEDESPVEFDSLWVHPFRKHHDAADPYSFVVTDGLVSVGVFTDIGRPSARFAHHFGQCHAAFLECNYDELMLQHGGYPWPLKERIRGGNGHLSNRQAAEFFRAHRAPHLTHLFLSHLSQQNNTPEMALRAFEDFSKEVEIHVAPRRKELGVFVIDGKPAKVQVSKLAVARTVQLGLFD